MKKLLKAAAVGTAAALLMGAAPPPKLPVEKHQLDNGLTVLLSQDKSLPVVAVEVRYLVGSGHERVGRSGFAHLFEHLMFQGSKNYDEEYFKPYEPIGGSVNGTTNTDRTNYYERVPSQYLELALWLESDRMFGLLPALTQKKLDNQRDVVKNERRQSYENRPYGKVSLYLAEEMYSKGHPYDHTTIGSHDDLTAASLGDVKGFFEKYYVPQNAVVTVVGDFEKAAAKAMVAKYFGQKVTGARAPAPKLTPPEQLKLKATKHLTRTDRVKLARVHLVWHTPGFLKPGDADMDLLASVLTHGKTSRLYKPLVYDQKVAKDVSAYQASRQLGSMFVVQATAANEKVSVDKLTKSLLAALGKALKTEPTKDEIVRAQNAWRKSFYGQVEGVLSRAQHLSSYYHMTGEADYFAKDLARYVDSTPSSVHTEAKKWIDLDAYLRLDIVPQPAEKPAKPGKGLK